MLMAASFQWLMEGPKVLRETLVLYVQLLQLVSSVIWIFIHLKVSRK